MKVLLVFLALINLSCSKKETSNNLSDEFYLKSFTQMTNDQVMCVKQICVTEEELYQQRGSPLYAQEDKLFYLKYKLAKEILLKKVLTEKLQGAGKTVSEYERELSEKSKVSDKEIEDYLKRFQFTDVQKGSEEWMELQKNLSRSKVQGHNLKMLKDFLGTKDIFVKIPKKYRPQIQLPFEKLVKYRVSSDDQLKITMVFNPARREQRNLLRMVESLSDHLIKVKKQVSFYYLPFFSENTTDALYQKIFICSLKIDNGSSYNSIMDVSKTFETEVNVFEFLTSRKIEVNQFKKCMVSQEIAKQAEDFNKLLKNLKLMPMVQILYNDELEFQIPGLIELNQRVEDKMKLKVLQRKL